MRRKLLAAVLIAILAAVFALAIFVEGSVLIHDRDDAAIKIAVSNGEREQSLRRILGGSFVLIDPIEGSLRITCRNGDVFETSYVTRTFHVRGSIERNGDGCLFIEGSAA